MAERKGWKRILPSGRAVRGLKPGLDDYFKANTRDDAGKLDLDGLVKQILPRILTGITLAAVPEILGAEEPERSGPEKRSDEEEADGPAPKMVRYINEEAMIASVDEGGAAGGWHELNYLKLRTKDDSGKTLFERLFNDEIADFMDLQSVVLELVWGGKKNLPPKARRLLTT